jgi:diguanylate cyclase (GGDEF)-like protein
MHSIHQFQQVSRTLVKATWLLLLFNGVCNVWQYGEASSSTVLVVILTSIYGIYLYYLQQRNQPTTIAHLIGETLLILWIDWLACFKLATFLLPLLIIRRAVYSKTPDIYAETACITVLYFVGGGMLGIEADAGAWLHQRARDSFLIALSVVLVQPMMQMAKTLQAEKEKLNQELNNAEQSYQQAAERALRDGLTGLYNYRAFQEDIHKIGQKFALLLIDVDYFKDFNDLHGHAAGDWVLREVGQVIVESVRMADKVYRYGGEEFAVVLEDVDEDIAMFTAERVRVRIANRAIFYENKELNGVTVSVGVSVYENLTIPIQELFEQTDQALYKAKAKGRNKVVFRN